MELDLPTWIWTTPGIDQLPHYLYLAALVQGRRVLELGGSAVGAKTMLAAGARQVVCLTSDEAALEAARRDLDDPRLILHNASLHEVLAALIPPNGAADADAAAADADETDVDGTDAAAADAVEAGEAAGAAGAVDAQGLDAQTTTSTALAGLLTEPFDLVLMVSPRARADLAEASARAEAMQRLIQEAGLLAVAISNPNQTTAFGALLEPFELETEASRGSRDEAFEAEEAALEACFPYVREVTQRLNLELRLQPNVDATATATVALREQPVDEPTPGARLLLMSRAPFEDPGAVSVWLDGAVVTARARQLRQSAERQLAEYDQQTLLLEAQLSQKEALIDDLEREALQAEVDRRELARQRTRLHAELETLQSERTEPGPEHARARELEATLTKRERVLSEREHALHEMSAQVHGLERENAWLRQSLDQVRAALAMRLAPAFPAAPLAEAAADAARALPRTDAALLEEATREIAALRRRLRVQAEGHAALAREAASLDAARRALLVEVDRRQALIEHHASELATQRALLDEFTERFEASAAQLEAQLRDEITAQLTREHRQVVERAGAELDALRGEHVQTVEVLNQQSRQLEDARTAIARVTLERDVHQRALDDARAALADARSRDATRDDDLQRAQQALGAREERLEALEAEVEQLRVALREQVQRGAALAARLERGEATSAAPHSSADLTRGGAQPGLRALDPVARHAMLDERLRVARSELSLRDLRISHLEERLETLRQRLRHRLQSTPS